MYDEEVVQFPRFGAFWLQRFFYGLAHALLNALPWALQPSLRRIVPTAKRPTICG
jgi:hypothetical protein